MDGWWSRSREGGAWGLADEQTGKPECFGRYGYRTGYSGSAICGVGFLCERSQECWERLMRLVAQAEVMGIQFTRQLDPYTRKMLGNVLDGKADVEKERENEGE